mmetsp:Transcript_55789/g.124589  ORF Transcript_55789/g.124589 Transcript_55789/m.124589 type:complete len:255 (-) Transcript_55789:726-1490(-)
MDFTSPSWISAAKSFKVGSAATLLLQSFCFRCRLCFNSFQAFSFAWNHAPGLNPATTWLALRCRCHVRRASCEASWPAHSYLISSKPSAVEGKEKLAKASKDCSVRSGTSERSSTETSSWDASGRSRSSGGFSPRTSASTFLASCKALRRRFTHSRKSAEGCPNSTTAIFLASGRNCSIARRSASSKPLRTLVWTTLRPDTRASSWKARRDFGASSLKAPRSGVSRECSGPGSLLRCSPLARHHSSIIWSPSST